LGLGLGQVNIHRKVNGPPGHPYGPVETNVHREQRRGRFPGIIGLHFTREKSRPAPFCLPREAATCPTLESFVYEWGFVTLVKSRPPDRRFLPCYWSLHPIKQNQRSIVNKGLMGDDLDAIAINKEKIDRANINTLTNPLPFKYLIAAYNSLFLFRTSYIPLILGFTSLLSFQRVRLD
jgi:hypothetical protein